MRPRANRIGAPALLVFLGLTAACENPLAEEPGCTPGKATLPSISHLQLTRDRDGLTVHLQRGIHNGAPTVRVWERRAYLGERAIPAEIHDLSVQLEGSMVNETWMGRVRQVYKQVPVVRYCSNRWSSGST